MDERNAVASAEMTRRSRVSTSGAQCVVHIVKSSYEAHVGAEDGPGSDTRS